MKKSNFAALILGVIGGVFFALGMCMALLPEWGMFRQGIISGVIGMMQDGSWHCNRTGRNSDSADADSTYKGTS